jgi:hypothetical protein
MTIGAGAGAGDVVVSVVVDDVCGGGGLPHAASDATPPIIATPINARSFGILYICNDPSALIGS